MPTFSSMIATAAILGGVGLGVAASSGAFGGGKKDNPESPALPPPPGVAPAPTPEVADTSAKAALEKQRKMRALAGGKTILTSEAPILSGSGGKTLLGS